MYLRQSHILFVGLGKPGLPEGLLGLSGQRRAGYYALRMGIRALQGGKASFFSITNSSDLMAVATIDYSNNDYLLAVNYRAKSYTVNADISALIKTGNGTVRELSLKAMDEVVGSLTLKGRNPTFAVGGRALFSLSSIARIESQTLGVRIEIT